MSIKWWLKSTLTYILKMLILSSHICSLLTLVFPRFIHFQWRWILTSTTSIGILDQNLILKYYIILIIKLDVNIPSRYRCYSLLSGFDVSHLQLSMLIFLRVEKLIDVSHLRPSMLIFLMLVTGPIASNYKKMGKIYFL